LTAIRENASNLGRGKIDLMRLHTVKELVHGPRVEEIQLRSGASKQLDVWFRLKATDNRGTHESPMTRNKGTVGIFVERQCTHSFVRRA
jgi:hypothetical protein